MCVIVGIKLERRNQCSKVHDVNCKSFFGTVCLFFRGKNEDEVEIEVNVLPVLYCIACKLNFE